MKTHTLTIIRRRQHEHYLVLFYSSGEKRFYPIVREALHPRVSRRHAFKRARDAEAWALLMDAYLVARRQRPSNRPPAPEPEPEPVRLTWWQRFLAWLKSLVWRPA